MAKLTPQEAQEKHARRLKSSTPDIQRGVERVQEAPGVKAAANVQKMRANLIKSIDSGKWERRVASVSKEDWKKDMIEKGIPRIAVGIDNAKAKTTEFFTQLFDHQDSIAGELDAMPTVTLEDGIAKAVHNMRRMSEFKRK